MFWMLGAGIVLAILGVVVWTTALWTTDNSELYCNSMYTGPALDVFLASKHSARPSSSSSAFLGTILGAAAFYQLFFADFINALGAIAPPLAAPILADFFVVGKEKKYDHKSAGKTAGCTLGRGDLLCCRRCPGLRIPVRDSSALRTAFRSVCTAGILCTVHHHLQSDTGCKDGCEGRSRTWEIKTS